MSSTWHTRPAGFGRRRAVAAVSLTACLTLVSGCGISNIGDLPLPGGADLGSDPYTVVIEFGDVLDLVPQSAVKVNDVSVGRVTDVALDGWRARVTVKLNDEVDLPDTAVASIRQTSILGEKFVSLAPPPEAEGGPGRLGDGDVIPVERTGNAPEIEEVLASLSLVLNGGAIGKAAVISQELNTAFGGREAETRTVLRRLDEFMTTADQSKAQIVDAIEQIDRLSRATNDQKAAIDAALDDLPAALTTVNEQRANLVKMLQALSDLGAVGSRVITASHDAVVTDLSALVPVLDNLASTGDALVDSLSVLPTFPFPDALLGATPTEAAQYQMGNYVNASVDFDTDFSRTVGLLKPAELASLKAALNGNGTAASIMAQTLRDETPQDNQGATP